VLVYDYCFAIWSQHERISYRPQTGTDRTHIAENLYADLDYCNPVLCPGGFAGLGQVDQDWILNLYQLSQELRLSSSENAPVQWTTGVYWLNTRRKYNITANALDFAPPLPLVVNNESNRNRAWAVFGQMQFPLSASDRLEISLRLDRDRRRQSDPDSGQLVQQGSWSAWQPKLTWSHDLSETQMLYVTAGRGFRSGGFNGVNDPAFKPENLSSYELGYKSTWLDQRLTFNSALFYEYDKDYQFFYVDLAAGGTQTIANLSRVELYGLESELNWRARPGLELFASLGLLGSSIREVGQLNTDLPIIKGKHVPRSHPYNAVVGAQWNFPLGNPARKLGAPIGAGCSVILKPPEEAPASAMLVARALAESGLPAGVMNLVYGVPDTVSRHLLGSRIIRKLSFTGSVSVGKHLMALAAGNAQRTTMELGGHAPVLVFDDADLDLALDLTVAGKYRNAGQVCISPTRFYVHEAIYDTFVQRFAERAAALRVGNGLDEGVQMGPLANARRPAAIAELIADARRHGAHVLAGGHPIEGGAGWFWQPSVLADVPVTARIMNEEPFGPVALMTPFSDLDAVIDEANRLPYGLAAYAFTRSSSTAMHVGEALETGMLGINTLAIAAPDAPFGGVKDSGHGAENAIEGLQACLVTKHIVQA